jgi:hypothetical protein
MVSIDDGGNTSIVINDILKEKEFKLSHLCARLFSMTEASRGHALPLFSGERATDVPITAASFFL